MAFYSSLHLISAENSQINTLYLDKSPNPDFEDYNGCKCYLFRQKHCKIVKQGHLKVSKFSQSSAMSIHDQ